MPEWTQVYTPVGGSLALSVAVAAFPLLVVALLLGVWRAPAWRAALFSLAAAFGVAVFVYGMPVRLAVAATVYGASVRPVPHRMARLLGDPAVRRHGRGRLLRRDQDTRWGASAAISDCSCCSSPSASAPSSKARPASGRRWRSRHRCSPVSDCRRSRQPSLCLVANTAPVAFGALATPIVTLAGVTALPLGFVELGRRPPVAARRRRHPDVLDGADVRVERRDGGLAGRGRLRTQLRHRAVPRLEFRRSVPHRHRQRAGLGHRR